MLGRRERGGLGLGDELRREVRVLAPGVELASCCWVSGLGLSLLAGGGPPCSPLGALLGSVSCLAPARVLVFWLALCPGSPQLWGKQRWWKIRARGNTDSYHAGYANLLKGQFIQNT